jgi:hypothetical protein
MAHKLVISIELETEDSSIDTSKYILRELDEIIGSEGYQVQVALIREGDRSAGNLLLPKLNGRFGEHLQNRKASLAEVLKDTNE